MNDGSRRKIIFHTPYPLNYEGKAASAIRPVKMRLAFEELGFEVIEVTGRAAERKQAIKDLKRRIRAGERFEFLYSESSTMPTALTEPHHLPTHPFMDLRFLRFCRSHGIPTGLFYRDIYWKFPDYLKAVGPLVATGTRALYHLDLLLYRAAVTRIFLPSLHMATEIPFTDPARCAALPPASDVVEMPRVDDPASMFYVGGLGDYYRLHECVKAIDAVPEAQLVLCTSAKLWNGLKAEYEPLMTQGHTKVVHENGPGLRPFYEHSAIGTLFMEPISYREFAAPLKFYEYLGHGRPVIAVEGSLVAGIIEETGAGWVLPYEAEALVSLLTHLRNNPQEYKTAADRAEQVRHDNTWLARARQAAAELGVPS